MGDWKKVYQCTECGKVYEHNSIPEICKKCGTVLGTKTVFTKMFYGDNGMLRSDKCRCVIARRTIFGWQIKR